MFTHRWNMKIQKLDRKTLQRVIRAGALATQLPFSMGVCVVFSAMLGIFLDKHLHTKPWLFIFFLFCGIAAGVKACIRIIKDLQKLTDEIK